MANSFWCVGSSKCACFHRIIVCKTLKICSNSVIFKFRLKVWLLLHVCVFSLHNRLDVTTTHARTPNSTKPICNEPSHQQNPEEICSAKRSNPNTEITYEMNKRKRVQWQNAGLYASQKICKCTRSRHKYWIIKIWERMNFVERAPSLQQMHNLINYMSLSDKYRKRKKNTEQKWNRRRVCEWVRALSNITKLFSVCFRGAKCCTWTH